MGETSILIAEHDSAWTRWARALRKPEHQLVLLVQHREEPEQDFFTRVKDRLVRLLDRGDWLHEIVVVAGSRWDEGSLKRRAQVLRSLLGRLTAAARPTQLFLDPGDAGGALAARGLQAIATTLCETGLIPRRLLHVVSGPRSVSLPAV